MNLTNEFQTIRQWAYSRGIYESGDMKTQQVKLQEEVGETSRAILTNNRDELIDAIGDCVIVLTNLARLAEQHFCDQCATCRGLGGDFANENGEGVWVECKDCGTLDIETCINKAYKEIKDRTGEMCNGTFIKTNIKTIKISTNENKENI